ncbi:polysaccharide deacetylase family protein [Gracilibacillus thailandensis]|uniref:Polysaccharide deacetylase family protein n=1 Tax=Gracilibacillus thailandensis TaxID=563735 RepID=A0A6N7R2C5_9BACI|nr:polysaccharide deacetylase family protein [Gracilibacillus thailandensis]MRI67611.1 polysaccharide deacetylase family protein [Gracilibacillus thailandensis]
MIRKHLFNIIFTVIFLGLFSLIINLYYDDVSRALYENDIFPADKGFDILECQNWRNEMRQFHVSDEDKAKQVTVLMYHRVIEEDQIDDIHLETNGDLVSTVMLKSEFDMQMQLLKNEGFTTLTLKELEAFIEGKIDVPKHSIVLTFDDGFKDNALEVAPILREHGFTGVSFVITGVVNLYDAKYEPGKYQYLSVEDIQNTCDVFEFESHTYNFHKRMDDHTAYLIGKPDELVRKDLETSIINLDGNTQAFASPYGAFDENNIQLFQKLGFNMAFTVVPETVRPGTDIYQIPRKEVYPHETIIDFKEKIGLQDGDT